MEHITTATEIRNVGRPLGRHVDVSQIEAYIDEVENMYVKPLLGDSLYLRIVNEGYDDEPFKTLVDGGSYTYNDGTYVLSGLRVAISYFVYAQNIMSGDFQSTRYGMVLKDDDYSTHLSSKERSDAYNNALEVGNRYLQECLAYCRATNILPKGKRNVASGGSMRIRKIGS